VARQNLQFAGPIRKSHLCKVKIEKKNYANHVSIISHDLNLI